MEFVVIQTVRSVLLSQVSTYLQEHLKLIDGLEASRSEALGQADKLMKSSFYQSCRNFKMLEAEKLNLKLILQIFCAFQSLNIDFWLWKMKFFIDLAEYGDFAEKRRSYLHFTANQDDLLSKVFLYCFLR